jgi:predicted nuclease of predicted toxin-antitoxin system
MRFLVDECTGPAVAAWLRERGHDVVSVYDQIRGSDDDAVIQIAGQEKRVLITNDKHFGEKVFRSGHAHCGVILLRLEDERPASKIAVLGRLLGSYADRLESSFIVVSERRVRFGKSR